MADGSEESVTDEAAELFLRLLEAPDDIEALREKQTFLERGEEERRAWNRVAQVRGARGARRRKIGLALPFVLTCLLVGLALMFGQDVRNRVLADARTGNAPEQIVLGSGDTAFLDARSALVDDTDGAQRNINLLAGAVYFEVEAAS
ncbi:MAG: hypothetical protein AAGH68_08680 [Pseudomonadota bacterium]